MLVFSLTISRWPLLERFAKAKRLQEDSSQSMSEVAALIIFVLLCLRFIDPAM